LISAWSQIPVITQLQNQFGQYDELYELYDQILKLLDKKDSLLKDYKNLLDDQEKEALRKTR